ncbi:hypothetical protein D6825_00460 [Candidatus Woesearchaeota archaeon]|nr:MAG: hypothetical protein D6825_00460 [Candidatus Woesearchaeota archaeon]
MGFKDKVYATISKKKSNLCVTLEANDGKSAKDCHTDVNKLSWCKRTVYAVAPYASLIKVDRNFIKDLSRSQTRDLVNLIHDMSMLAIDDSKLVDVGGSLECGLYQACEEGFDAVTFAPFQGNTEEAVKKARDKGLGLASLVLMPNKYFRSVKREPVHGLPACFQYAREVGKFKADCAIIAAPSNRNYATEDEVLWCNFHVGPETMVLAPSVNLNSNNLVYMNSLFKDRLVVDIGKDIIYSKKVSHQAKSAKEFLNKLSALKLDDSS